MRKHRLFVIVAVTIVIVCAMLFSKIAAAEEDISKAGARVNVVAEDANDVYLAGAQVSLKGSIDHDVAVAGAVVEIDAETGGDMHVVGARVNISGKVSGETAVAGAEIVIGLEAHGPLQTAGATIVINEYGHLHDEAVLYGATVSFMGTSTDALQIIADQVIFEGRVEGPVVIEAKTVSITDKADITGVLEIRSVEAALISSEASLAGNVTQTLITEDEFLRRTEREKSIFSTGLILMASAAVLGLLCLFFARGSVERSIRALKAGPLKSLLYGFVIVLCIVMVSIIAAITVLGIPFALALLFVLPLLCLIGLAIAAYAFSDSLFNRDNKTNIKSGKRIAMFLFGILTLASMTALPMFGSLIIILALVAGIGAYTVTISSSISSIKPTQV